MHWMVAFALAADQSRVNSISLCLVQVGWANGMPANVFT